MPRPTARPGVGYAGTLLFVFGFLGWLASTPTAAQDVIVPADSAGGYDHVSDPPEGAFSSVDWCFSLADDLAGRTIEVTVSGPTGELTGTGVVAGNGTVKVPVGITTDGEYAITGIEVVETGSRISTEGVESVSVVFDPELVDCLGPLEPAPAPPTTTVPFTTVPATTVPSTTAAPSTSASAPTPIDESAEGRSYWPLVAVGSGIALMLAGLLVAFWPETTIITSDRCEPERREVARAETEIAKLRAKEKKYRDEQKELEAEARRLDHNGSSGSKRQRDYRTAERLRNDADRLGRKAEYTAREIEVVQKQLTKANRALAACMKRPAPPEPGGPGGTTAPPTPVKRKEALPCCTDGNWIGINTYSGGGSVAGGDIGTIYLVCLSDPTRTAIVTWTGERRGVFLGAELSIGLFLLVNSGRHPTDLKKDVAKVMTGWDWDISLGVSWAKLLKSGAKSAKSLSLLGELAEDVVKAGSAARSIDRATLAGDTAKAAQLTKQNKVVLERLIDDGYADELADSLAKGASSAIQAGGTGVNIPYGGGLQLGVWFADEVDVDLLSYTGCENCDAGHQ